MQLRYFQGLFEDESFEVRKCNVRIPKKIDTDHFFEEFVIILSNFHQMKSNLKHYFELDDLQYLSQILMKFNIQGVFRNPQEQHNPMMTILFMFEQDLWV